FALDGLVGDEREVIADENARAETDADGETPIMAVSQPERVLVAGVGASERQEAEVPGAVVRHAMMLGDDLVAVHAECCADEVYHPEVRNGHMGGRCV